MIKDLNKMGNSTNEKIRIGTIINTIDIKLNNLKCLS